jgi:hypothetical protein
MIEEKKSKILDYYKVPAILDNDFFDWCTKANFVGYTFFGDTMYINAPPGKKIPAPARRIHPGDYIIKNIYGIFVRMDQKKFEKHYL